MKTITWMVAVLGSVFAATADAALREMFPQEANAGGAAVAAQQQAAPQGGALVRQRQGRPAQQRVTPAPQDEAVYPFFNGATFTTTVTRVSQGYGGAEIVKGKAQGTYLTSLSVYTPQGERHEVHGADNGRVYVAVSKPDGTMEMQELDPSAEPSWDEHMEAEGPAAAPEGEPPEVAMQAGDTEIDVMLVFDTTAVAWANSSGGGVNAFAQAAVNKMSVALENSGVPCNMRLAGVYCPSYTYAGDITAALYAVTDGTGGLSGVAAQRNTYGADVVSMMVDTGSASGTTGIGWVYNGSSTYAYSVCAIRAVNSGHTMSHEIGHNVGCGHSKNQASSPGPTTGIPYAAGWYFTGGNSVKYHTIMAYNSDGYNPGLYTPCNLFSTPLKTYQGVAVGDAADGDNARCFREKMMSVAAYRVAPGVPVTPSSVAASKGAYPDKVRVTWGAASGATSYKVYRSTASYPSGNGLLATVTSPTLQYDDATALPNVFYNYWVKASNSTGDSMFSALSQGFLALSISLGDAVNAPALTWTTGGTGNLGWFAQPFITHDDLYAAQSGAITHNQESWIETAVTGPGTLKFWWRVSSEANYDKLTCTITGMTPFDISGEQAWAQRTVTISAGTKTIRWTYSKDVSVDSGSDCGWLDQVEWIPDTPVPTATQSSPRPVPYSWLNQMFPGNNGTGATYEWLATNRFDNGYYGWESYVAGLVPTNAASKFMVTNVVVNTGNVLIKWNPDLGSGNRAYKVEGKTNLTDIGWHWPTNNATRFFKVSVDLLP